MERTTLAGLIALVAAALTACNNPLTSQLPVPGRRSGIDVQSVVERGDYLDAVLVGERHSARLLFFKTDEACARMLVPEKLLVFREVDQWGEISDEEGACSPIGSASLAQWRDSRPRGRSGPQVRRGRAQYRTIFQDEEYVQVRGRFPNAQLVGFGAAADLVAFLPNTEECANHIKEGTAATEFRSRGNAVIVLIAQGQCPVAAFALPFDPRAR
jgi:hypothetical protein